MRMRMKFSMSAGRILVCMAFWAWIALLMHNVFVCLFVYVCVRVPAFLKGMVVAVRMRHIVSSK